MVTNPSGDTGSGATDRKEVPFKFHSSSNINIYLKESQAIQKDIFGKYIIN